MPGLSHIALPKSPMIITKWLLILCCWLLPFSFELSAMTHRLTLPTEPLLLLVAVTSLLWYKTVLSTLQQFRKSIVLVVLITGCIWSLIASIFSVDLMISLKYIIVQFLHFYCFCILSLVIYRHDSRFIYHLFSGLFVTVALALAYIWWHHYSYDFRPDTAQVAGDPFFRDHTHFGLFWLLMIPFALALSQKFSFSRGLRWFLVPALFLGVFLSFSRAVWVTAALLTFIFVWYHFEKLRWIMALGLILLASIIYSSNPRSESHSRTGSTSQLIRSLQNLPEDVSIRERVNRYSAAIKMGMDRPITGFGPGTFPKYFIPFQHPKLMTRISVTTYERHERGRGGSTHSEYLRVLSEEGFTGFFLWILITLIVLIYGVRSLDRADWLMQGSLATFICFAFHGLFNNHLHDDKIAAIVWLAIAIILYKTGKKQTTIASSHE